jgi:MoaA/NifB/PqqE/SkfB family radical SAM enzyme
MDVQTRYDYLLHATVPTAENWGIHEPLPLEVPTDFFSLLKTFRENLAAPKVDLKDLLRLKQINRALAQAEWEARTSHCESRPGVVQLSQTEVCNLLCTYCRPMLPQNLKTLPRDRCLSVLHQLLPTAYEFIPYCWGEPLLSPDFAEMCELAARYAVSVSFVTNLHHLTDKVADAFVRYVTRAQVSVDTVDPAGFARVRRGGDLRKLEANLATLNKLPASGNEPWLGVSAVLTRSNMDGIPDLIRWAADHGFRGICIRRVVVRETLPNFRKAEEIDLLSAEYLKLLDTCRSMTVDLGLTLNMPDPVRGKRSTPPCRCLWDHVYVSAGGELNMCVFSHRNPWGLLPLVENYWNTDEIMARRFSWTDETRCEECSSLDFLERADVSQVRGY